MNHQLVSVLHQNEGGIGKFIPDAQDISRVPREISRVEENLDSGEENFEFWQPWYYRYCRYNIVQTYLVHTGLGHTANTSTQFTSSLSFWKDQDFLFSSYSLIFHCDVMWLYQLFVNKIFKLLFQQSRWDECDAKYDQHSSTETAYCSTRSLLQHVRSSSEWVT